MSNELIDQFFTEDEIGCTRNSLRIEELLYKDTTDLQSAIIFRNKVFGRVLVLDGMIQCTEGDEFIYHEMLTHVPCLAHGNVKKILIIGGGDGGMLRRALMYPGADVTMVEIDDSVIKLSKKYLPAISNGAYDNPRGHVLVADGAAFVKQTKERFDVIIIDSGDPIGPATVLFTEEFYRDCHNCLTPGGILVTQSGAPMTQSDELRSNYHNMAASFAEATFYTASVTTYPSGLMAFGWATDNLELRRQSADTIRKRMEKINLECRYFTPEIHAAAFVLPRYIQDIVWGKEAPQRLAAAS